MGILALIQMVVLAVLGLWTLGVGVAMAFGPGERRYGLMRPLSLATAFAAACAMCSGLAAALMRLAGSAPGPEATAMLVGGIAEAMVPGVFGFGVLALAWGFAAVGVHRQP
ncbi:MAG: hypothetical protein ACOY3Y_02395 [Acidobacteriota bacterium]